MAGSSSLYPISTRQSRIAELARQMPGAGLSTLSHHMDLAWLREAYRRTRRDGAPGVDGQTAADYEVDLDTKLKALLGQAKSGTYRAPPVRRVHIPKGDGKTRPIGIPTYEDKVLQRAVLMLLEPIYEEDFYDFSYGFRPGRSAHDALEALGNATWGMRGGWVLEADIRSFFDTLDHEKLRDLLHHRVTDGVIGRLIGKWLNAGVLEGGVVTRAAEGTPQGGVISPILANIFLHEVVDAWWVRDVLPRMRGRAHLFRYADDFVMVFEEEGDSRRVHKALPQRMQWFGLTLHPEKTRLVPFLAPSRNGSGSRPGSFDFLGFTHYWGKARRGFAVPKRKTASSRFSRGIKAIGRWLKVNRHKPVAEQARVLRSKLTGHMNYFGIIGNWEAISRFAYKVRRLWKKWLDRRSQRGRMTWETFNRLFVRYPLPPPKLAPKWRRQPAKP